MKDLHCDLTEYINQFDLLGSSNFLGERKNTVGNAPYFVLKLRSVQKVLIT